MRGLDLPFSHPFWPIISLSPKSRIGTHYTPCWLSHLTFFLTLNHLHFTLSSCFFLHQPTPFCAFSLLCCSPSLTLYLSAITPNALIDLQQHLSLSLSSVSLHYLLIFSILSTHPAQTSVSLHLFSPYPMTQDHKVPQLGGVSSIDGDSFVPVERD